MELRLSRVKRLDTADEKGLILFEVPQRDRALFWQMIAQNEREYWDVTIKPWYRRRTTGQRSQNNHLHGHMRQIAGELGHNTLDHIQRHIMEQACIMGYPEVEDPLSKKMVPKDQVLASTTEFSLLIEAAHLLAAELEIHLKEE